MKLRKARGIRRLGQADAPPFQNEKSDIKAEEEEKITNRTRRLSSMFAHDH